MMCTKLKVFGVLGKSECKIRADEFVVQHSCAQT